MSQNISNAPLNDAEETAFYANQAISLFASLYALAELERLQRDTGFPDADFQHERMKWITQTADILRSASKPPAPAAVRAALGGFSVEVQQIETLVNSAPLSDQLN